MCGLSVEKTHPVHEGPAGPCTVTVQLYGCANRRFSTRLEALRAQTEAWLALRGLLLSRCCVAGQASDLNRI